LLFLHGQSWRRATVRAGHWTPAGDQPVEIASGTLVRAVMQRTGSALATGAVQTGGWAGL